MNFMTNPQEMIVASQGGKWTESGWVPRRIVAKECMGSWWSITVEQYALDRERPWLWLLTMTLELEHPEHGFEEYVSVGWSSKDHLGKETIEAMRELSCHAREKLLQDAGRDIDFDTLQFIRLLNAWDEYLARR